MRRLGLCALGVTGVWAERDPAGAPQTFARLAVPVGGQLLQRRSGWAQMDLEDVSEACGAWAQLAAPASA